MTKVYYEIEKINNTSVPNLEKADSNLRSAANIIASAPKPSFPMAGYVGSLPSIIERYANSCQDTIEWLEDCSEKFSKFNNDTIDTFDKFIVDDTKEKLDQIGII